MEDFIKDYVEMNIDEMKQVKETWQIHLKIFTRKLRNIANIPESKENRWELKQLEAHYSFCIESIKDIMAIYSNLINLAEDCDLDEDFFLKEIYWRLKWQRLYPFLTRRAVLVKQHHVSTLQHRLLIKEKKCS